jgi:hypothetical protein
VLAVAWDMLVTWVREDDTISTYTNPPIV